MEKRTAGSVREGSRQINGTGGEWRWFEGENTKARRHEDRHEGEKWGLRQVRQDAPRNASLGASWRPWRLLLPSFSFLRVCLRAFVFSPFPPASDFPIEDPAELHRRVLRLL